MRVAHEPAQRGTSTYINQVARIAAERVDSQGYFAAVIEYIADVDGRGTYAWR